VTRLALALGTALLAAGTLNAADGDLPSLGTAGGASISIADEHQLGQQIMREVRRSGALLDDPLVTEYLQGIGSRLASNSDHPELPFSFFAVRDSSINAFALPGGFIGVNAGLVLMADSETEFAGVMAHEVAHVTQRHVARQIEASRGMSLAGLAALLGAIAVATSGAGPDATQAAVFGSQALLAQQKINFTRGNEYEADRVGIGILAAAGYDPEGMIGFFEKMQRDARYAESRRPELLSTHPLSTARITEARSRARRLEIDPIPESRLFGLILARIRVLSSDDPRVVLEQFEKRRDPDDATRYGRGLALVQLGRPLEALPLLEALVERDPSIAAYHLALAEAQARADHHEDARASYRRGQRLFPTSAALSLSYASWLLERDEPGAAYERVMDLMTRVPDEPRHFLLLAQAAARAGADADSRYFNAERFLLEGDLLSAIDQLKLAMQTPDLSPFQRARFAARLERLLGILATLSHDQRAALERERGG